ncbi:hypothetical protein F4782DRAFT_532529 [Xylaria castorea]|nr:hypothetical protein F4782DRAFT_532529 [Xylaria castorea]
MPSQETTKTVHLKATYTSPTHPEPHLISSTPLSLPTSSSQSQAKGMMTVAEKTAYLSSLRTATVALQETVNAALTARMEEDAARAQVSSTDEGARRAAAGGKSEGADEVAEEENYGEEVPEDDE